MWSDYLFAFSSLLARDESLRYRGKVQIKHLKSVRRVRWEPNRCDIVNPAEPIELGTAMSRTIVHDQERWPEFRKVLASPAKFGNKPRSECRHQKSCGLWPEMGGGTSRRISLPVQDSG
jgi:hypothetical protein